MKKRTGITLTANAAIILGCSGFFAPTRMSCRRRCPASAALGNDYLDSLDKDEKKPKRCWGGVNDYLNSLGDNSNGDESESTSDKIKVPTIESERGHMPGGMFNVQTNYFDSLGATAGDIDSAPSPGDDVVGAAETSTSSDVGDLWEQAAAFLNFNIGPEIGMGTDPWETAAAAQQNYYSDDEHLTNSMTYEEMVAHHKARLCPKMLLTQRAIQSFMYLSEECRDPHSGRWLEDFLGLRNLGNYHGTGAFNVTRYPAADDVLYDIMAQPNQKMIVSAKRRGRGHGGWSKNNPYLRERWVEFKIDIRPAGLVQRLLPVRDQLANEFDAFLDLILVVNERITQSYFDHLHYLASRQHSPASSGGMAFERISVDVLANYTDFQEGSSSPLFRGNFDLLHSLCTQASAYRLLRDLQSHSPGDITTSWFEQFYADNVPLHFDGDQPFGRADDFLELLFRSTPSLVVASNGEPIGWTDPIWVVERIIAVRSEIACEWKDVMREVKEDQRKLSDDLFRFMIEGTIGESGNDAIEIEEEITFDDLSDSAGAFE